VTDYAVAPRIDRREQARQDRRLTAEIARDDAAARYQARIAERESAARMRREAAAGRRAAKAQRRAELAGAAAAVSAWISGHVIDLLFVPTIAVPAALSWTAMAAFGDRLYGPVGVMLPAFSEGAMWSFAAAVTITLRRHPERPVWHLRTGIGIFAVFGAALNFLHGLAVPSGLFPGLPAGILTGAVMALISVSGVIAHQLITAGPQKPRKGDEDAEAAPETVADKPDPEPAGADLDAMVDAAFADMARRWTPPPVPGMTTPEPAAGRDTNHDSGDDTASDTEGDSNSDTGRDSNPGTDGDIDRDTKTRGDATPRATAAGPKRGQPTAARVRQMRRRHPDMPPAEIARRLKLNIRTVQRHLAGTPGKEVMPSAD
jgi:hypothetical protein